MSDTNYLDNYDDQPEGKLPSGLNTLTILTYIGCALAFVSGIWNYVSICDSAEKIAAMDTSEMGGWVGNMLNSSLDMMNKQCDNRLVILVATLATTALCFFGAMMMRQLKKQGFIIYVLGEIIGPASMMVIAGSGGLMSIVGIIIPVLFVIMYATQRKYLIK